MASAASKGSAEELPDKKELMEAVKTAQKVQKTQAQANDLKSKAMRLTNSKERERMLQEAYAKEVEAHGEGSKLARRMQSGPW
jgi:hypothetical protein